MSDQSAQNQVGTSNETNQQTNETDTNKLQTEMEKVISSEPQEDTLFLSNQEMNNLKSRVSKELDHTIEDTKATEEAIQLVQKVVAKISLDQKNTPSLELLGPDSTKDKQKHFFENFCGQTLVNLLHTKQASPAMQDLIVKMLDLFQTLLLQLLQRKDCHARILAKKFEVLFDPSRNFYQHLRQHTNQNQQNDENQNKQKENQDEKADNEEQKVPACLDYSEFNGQEREWRQSLKKGQKIDVLKQDATYKHQMWTLGEITQTVEIPVKTLTVRFINDSSVNSAELRPDSKLIAPEGSLSTESQSWKKEVKVGDKVDVLADKDSTNWQTATVVWVDERENPAIPMIKVGFRTYHEEGEKRDEMGSYSGLSKGMDTLIGLYTVRVHKAFGMTGMRQVYKGIIEPFKPAKEKVLTEEDLWQVQQKQDERDLLQIEQTGDPKMTLIYATWREKSKSQTLIDLMNKFGENGGFDLISQMIQDPETPLQTVLDLLKMISNPTKLYHKSFIDQYFLSISQTVGKKLITSSEKQLRETRFVVIQDIIEHIWNKLMGRLYPSTEIMLQIQTLMMQLAGVFLRQPFLEKRIDGAKLVDTVCKEMLKQKSFFLKETIALKKKEAFKINLDKLIHYLDKEQILQVFFDKKTVHEQLVQRSDGLLRLYMSQGLLKQEVLEEIWSNCQADEQLQRYLIAVFQLIAGDCDSTQMRYLIEKIMGSPKAEIKADEIELMQSFGQACVISGEKLLKENLDLVLRFFWDYLTCDESQKYLTSNAVTHAVGSFYEVFRLCKKEIVVEYFSKIVQKLSEGSPASFVCSKLTYKYLMENSKVQQKELTQFCDEIQKNHRFLNILIQDLINYSRRVTVSAKEIIEKSGVQPSEIEAALKLADRTFEGQFSHSDQITQRINTLQLFLKMSSIQLTGTDLEELWHEMIEQSVISFNKKQMQSMFNSMCEMAVNQQESPFVKREDLLAFFAEVISNESTFFDDLDLLGFQCFQSYFVITNSLSERLMILKEEIFESKPNTKANQKEKAEETKSNEKSEQEEQGGQKAAQKVSTAVGPDTSTQKENSNKETQSSSSAVKLGNLDVMSLSSPEQMEGIDGIWRIATECRVGQVFDAVIRLLLQIYTNVTESLEEQVSIFEDIFIERCFNKMNRMRERIETRSKEVEVAISAAVAKQKANLPAEERYIVRCLRCLEYLVWNSEANGMQGVRPHKAMGKGDPIDSIHVTNCYNYRKDGEFRQKFDLKLHSNYTIFDLKKAIADQLSIMVDHQGNEIGRIKSPHPITLKIVLNRFMDRTLSQADNGGTVSDMFIRKGDKLTVKVRGNEEVVKMPLTRKNGSELSLRAAEVIQQLWVKYSVQPAEGQARFIGRDEAQNLIQNVSTYEEFKPKSIMAYAGGDSGNLQFEEFMSFYLEMARTRPSMVRDNLLDIQIMADLKSMPKAGEGDDILQIRKSKSEMPRYKISNNQSWFSSLTHLLDKQTEVSETTSCFIDNLCTNEAIMKTILEINKNSEKSDKIDEILSKDQIFQNLYPVSIIQTFLAQTEHDTSSQEGLMRASWSARFLEAGGLDKLFSVIKGCHTIITDETKAKEISIERLKQTKIFLVNLLNIFQLFSTSLTMAYLDDPTILQLEPSNSALFTRLKTGKLYSYVTKKVLRKLEDKEENELEDAFHELCGGASQSTINNFFQIPLAGDVVSATANENSKKTAAKMAEDSTAITEENLFGEGNDYDGSKEEKERGDQKVSEYNDKQPQEPEMGKQKSLMEQKSKDSKAIKTAEGRAEAQQINLYQQIKSALSRDQIEVLMGQIGSLIPQWPDIALKLLSDSDVDKIAERGQVCAAISILTVSVMSNEANFMAFKNWRKTQEDKNRDIKEEMTVDQFLIETLTTQMSLEVRRNTMLFLQLITTKRDGLKSKSNTEWLLDILLDHIKDNGSRMEMLSEEYYELIGDCCLQIYQAEKELSQCKGEFYRFDFLEVFQILMQALRSHWCIYPNLVESLKQAKALESLLLTMADILYFANKELSYEDLTDFIKKEKVLEEILYEILFYVAGKTQNKHRNKASRIETRKAAYQLLYRILRQFDPADMSQFLQEHLWPLLKDIPRPVNFSHAPQDKIRKADEHMGIRNLGNVCYMISMLQQFFMIPAFRYQLFKAFDEKAEVLVEHKDKMIDDNMLHQLQRLYGFLEISERSEADITDFCYSFKDWEGQPTKTYEQQDAQEFLNRFFDCLEEALRNTSQHFLCQDIFQGSSIDVRTCKSCGFENRSIQTFYTLTLPVENRTSIQQSLQKRLDGETIDEYNCDNCKKKVQLQKFEVLGKMPNVLIVHLQRLVFDFTTYQNKKINTKFDFPTILDLQKFSSKENLKLESLGNDSEEVQAKLNQFSQYEDSQFVYRLVGIVIHRGRAGAGHYWSLIHTQRGKNEPDPSKDEQKWVALDKDWKEFNDESVKFFFHKNIEEQAFGGYLNQSEMQTASLMKDPSDYGKSAYILVYERKQKETAREIISPKESKDDLKNIRQVDFNKVEPVLPENIKEIVTKDNQAYTADRQIFQPTFFTFVEYLLRHCVSELLDQQESYSKEAPLFSPLQKTMLKIGKKVTFDLMSHAAKYHKQFAEICSSMRSIFSYSDPMEHVGSQDVHPSMLSEFMQKVFLEDKCEHFFKIMFDSTSQKEVREHCGKTAARVISKAIKIVGRAKSQKSQKAETQVIKKLEMLVDEIVPKLFNKIHARDCQKRWSRMQEYYEMLSQIGTSGRHQAEYLLSKFDDLVIDLCDIVLQQKSPKTKNEVEPRIDMGSTSNPVKFGPLIFLASFLVRLQSTPTTDKNASTFITVAQKSKKYSDDEFEEMENEEEQDDDVDIEESDANQRQQMIPEDQTRTISEQAIEFFTNEHLFELVASKDYDVFGYGTALAHLCYRNEKMSEKVAKMALKFINEGTHPSSLIIMKQVCCLRDLDAESGEDLARKRFEWFFGVASLKYKKGGDEVLEDIGLVSSKYDLQKTIIEYQTTLAQSGGPESQCDSKSYLQAVIEHYSVQSMGKLQAKISTKTSEQQSKLSKEQDDPKTSSVVEQLMAQGMTEGEARSLYKTFQDSSKEPIEGEQVQSDEQKKPDEKVIKTSLRVQVDKQMSLEIIDYLLQIATHDHTSLNYFCALPGCSPLYSKYLDWIVVYLESLRDFSKTKEGKLSEEQTESLEDCGKLAIIYFSYIQTFNKMMLQKENDKILQQDLEDSSVSMINTGNGSSKQTDQLNEAQQFETNVWNPLSKLILKVKKVEKSAILLQKESLTIQIDSLSVAYVKNQPTSRANLAIPDCLLAENAEKTHEQTASNQTAVVVYEPQTDEPNQSGASQFKRPKNFAEFKLNDEDPAVQFALGEMLKEPETQWIFELPEDDKKQALENMVKEQIYELVQQYYADKMPALSEEDQQNQAQIAEQKDSKSANLGTNNEESENKETTQDNVDVDLQENPFAKWPSTDSIEHNSELLYQIRIQNSSDKDQNFSFVMQNGLQKQFYPQQDTFSGQISAQKNERILLLRAPLNNKDWSEICDNNNWNIQVESIEAGTNDAESANNKPTDNNLGGVSQSPQTVDTQVGPDSFGMDSGNAFEKNCGACTMLNPIDAKTCYICSTPF